ncbi:coiled-coil domain-containing protein 124 isoform X1 [Pelodiscus sinensis]|uniref:coiled-coil domain-containing protein 124 isoform X1 n=1 Tax=Pelodiscus sinensis TaxID=13735 RepID=UPI003F6BB8F1
MAPGRKRVAGVGGPQRWKDPAGPRPRASPASGSLPRPHPSRRPGPAAPPSAQAGIRRLVTGKASDGRSRRRQEEREKRRLEQLERKKEMQRLLEEEDSKLKGKSPKPLPPGKITRAQIEETLRKDQQQKENGDEVEKQKSHLDVPLEENINRRVLEEGTVEARTIEDAIAVLSVADDLDRHPERRMKAAFAAFEEVSLPRLKQENPNMRLSQLKQLLKKEWMRSPDNPMNQRHMTYNSQK